MTLTRRDWLVLAGGSAALGIACKGGQSEPGKGSNASGDIVIGHYASMSGGTAHFGQDTDKALRLALEQVNAAGGINGRMLRAVTLDTRGDSAEAANAVTRLIDVENVVALIGEVASSLSLAGGRVAQRRRIPMISPSSTNPKVTQVGDYIFRVCFLDPFQGRVMARFARETLKLSKVAVLKDIKNDYSLGLADAFVTGTKEAGGSISAEQSYSQGDTDFSAQLTAIKGAGADGIFVPGYYSEVGAIARTAKRLGLQVPLMGGDGWDAPDLFKIGGDALDGCYFSNHFAPDTATEQATRFVADFTAKYGQAPTGLGALGYDALMVLADAMRRATSMEPTAIRDALAATKDFEAVTGKITMDQNRDAQKSAVVLEIKGGKARYLTSIAP